MLKKIRKQIVYKDYLLLNFLFKTIRFVLGTKKKIDNKIIFICFKLIGDSVFTIPAIKYLLTFYPEKEVVIFSYDYNKAVYENVFSNFNYEIFSRDEIDLDSAFINSKIIKKIWKHNPDIIVDFTSGIFAATILLLSRSKTNIGFNLPIFRSVYDTFSPKRAIPHLIDMYIEPLKKHFNQEELQIDYSFPVSIKQNGTIAICPFAGWKAKEWGIKNYFELGIKLNKNYKVRFILPSNTLNKDIEQEFIKEKMEIVFTENSGELINELKKVNLIISNDSGPIYIGNMLRKPTFTIYGPTNPAFSLPFGKYHAYIQKQIKCSPEKNIQYCYTNAGRSCNHFDCMKLLTIQEVSLALSDFMTGIGIGKS